MATEKTNRYHFPWRGGNRFRLLVNGNDFFPPMLNAIRHAEHFIALEMYLVISGKVLDQFIDALVDAATRGVKVFILLDDFGARSMHRHDRYRLDHANVRLCFYNPLQYGHLRRHLFRDHRKLLLVDNRIAYVGGAGIADDFAPDVKHKHYWHDLMVEIQGACINDWWQLFIENWPDDTNGLEQFGEIPSPAVARDDAQLGRVTLVQRASRQEVKRSLVKRLKSAEHRIWITTAYFVPSWKIRRALRRSARRGVDVRLLLPGPHTDHPGVRHAGRRFYYSLLRHGVRIFEYQPRFNHCKASLCDHWCSIGSSNFDRWNLTWNLEGNQEIDDQDFAAELKLFFERDLQQCVEIQREAWRRRPWHRRLLEWFWGRVDIWLQRQTMRWRRRKD
jgi:cardiolipin synthase